MRTPLTSTDQCISAASLTRVFRRKWFWMLELPATAVLAVLVAGSGGTTVDARDVGPVGTWVEDLTDDLDDAEDDLDEAAMAVGESQGPLSEPELSIVGDALARALGIINDILDPNTYPSLDTPDGSVNTGYDPDDLPTYANDCFVLIKQARAELNASPVDHKVIGTDLKTIRNLIVRATPHNYQTLAGVD